MTKERGDDHQEQEPLKVQLGVPFTISPDFDRYDEKADLSGISRADTIVLEIENFGVGEIDLVRDQYGGRTETQSGGVGDPVRTLVPITNLRATQINGFPILTRDTAPIYTQFLLTGQPEQVLQTLTVELRCKGKRYINDEPGIWEERHPLTDTEFVDTAVFIGWDEVKDDERTTIALFIPQDSEVWRDIEFVIDRRTG